MNNGQVIPCSVRWIPSVLLLDLEEEPLEDGEVLLIIDASERYHRYANPFPLYRPPDSLNTSPGIIRSHSKTRKQKYPQGLSTRPHRRRKKPSTPTSPRTYPQARSDDFAPLPLHLSYSSERKTVPSGSVSITEPSTALPYPTNTTCRLSVSS